MWYDGDQELIKSRGTILPEARISTTRARGHIMRAITTCMNRTYVVGNQTGELNFTFLPPHTFGIAARPESRVLAYRSRVNTTNVPRDSPRLAPFGPDAQALCLSGCVCVPPFFGNGTSPSSLLFRRVLPGLPRPSTFASFASPARPRRSGSDKVPYHLFDICIDLSIDQLRWVSQALPESGAASPLPLPPLLGRQSRPVQQC